MVGIFFFATRSWGLALAPGSCLPPGSFSAPGSCLRLALGCRLALAWRLALFVRRRCGAIPDNTHAWLPFSLLFSPLFPLLPPLPLLPHLSSSFLFFSLLSSSFSPSSPFSSSASFLSFLFFLFFPLLFLSTHWGLLVYCAALPALGGGEILLFGQKMVLLLACEIKICYFCGYGR